VRKLVDPESILDAARDLVAAAGPRAATLDAIATASGAPTGSIYHRFRSIDAVIARAWLRAIARSREASTKAAADRTGADAVVAIALAGYDFCLRERAEARLLVALRPADLLGRALPDEIATQVAAVNEPVGPVIASLARACLGRADRAARDRILLAMVDLPYGAASRYLDLEISPPAARRVALERAVRATLGETFSRHPA
jgi:AcrR family transcriptional regulator